MSALTVPSVPFLPARGSTSWIQADRGLWVAARSGSHLGRIERRGRTFRAYGDRGASLGDFDSLTAAQRAVAGA